MGFQIWFFKRLNISETKYGSTKIENNKKKLKMMT